MANINNTASNTLLSGTSGKDSIQNGGWWDGGRHNGGSYVTISAGAGNDTIRNESWWDGSKYIGGSYVSIAAGDGNDYIDNWGNSVTIDAGAGNDSIYNSGSKVTILGGDGNDSIYNSDSKVTIFGGDGNDYVDNWSGDKVTINGGAGDDSIVSWGDSVSINAGMGDDSIYNRSANVLFNYTSGDGNDTIVGFKNDDTLLISGTSYSTQESGYDVIVTVDKGKILLQNAYATADSIHINDETITLESKVIKLSDGGDIIHASRDSISIVGGDGNDSIYNSSLVSNVSIVAGAGNDYISNGGSKVTILGGDGNDSIYSWSGDKVTINGGSGNDSIDNSGSDASIDVGAGDDYIRNSGKKSKVDAGAGNDYIYNGGSKVTILAGAGDDYIRNSGEKSKVDAGTGNDSIYNWYDSVTIDTGVGNDSIHNDHGSRVTIHAGVGDDSIHNNGGELVTINAGDGNDYINTSGANVTMDAGDGNDYIDNYKSYKVSMDAGAGNDTIRNNGGDQATINAGDDDDLIVLSGNTFGTVIVYNEGDGNDTITGFNEDDTLKISGGSYSSQISGSDIILTVGEGNITLQGAASLSAVNIDGEKISWKLNGTTAAYGSLVITGVTSLDGIKLDGTTVTVSASSLGTNKVTVSDGYKLKLGSDVDKTSATKAWTLDGTTATYKQTTTAGYKLVDNEIIFSAAETKTLATVTGVKSLDGLKVKGTTVTVTKSSLGTNDVTLSGDGYTLALGSTVPAPTTAKATYASGKYKTAGVSKAGYSLDGNTIRYVAKDIKTIKFSGADDDATVKNFYLSGNVITLGKAAVKTDGTAFKLLTDGYTLKLGNGMAAPSTDDAWTLSKTTAKLKRTTTAGYSLAADSITYSKKSSKTLATVTGVKSLDGLSVNGKVVTVNAASLGTNDVTISDGYTLALGSDADAATTKKSWSLSGTTATYKQTTAAGYSLEDNSIVYSKKISSTLATVKGVNDESGLKVSGKTIKLSGDALSKKVTVSGAYTFDFDSDYSNASITGSGSDDTIIARGKNIFVTGGDGSDVFALKSTGTIGDYDSEDKISLSSAADISTDGNDLIFDGKVTVAGAADKSVTYIEGGVEKIFEPEENDDVQYNAEGTGVTLTANYSEDSFVANDTLVTIDASAVNQEINIVANKKANSIVGSEEDDTIDGGAAKDTIRAGDGNDQIFGGKGNDKLFGGAGADSLWGGLGEDTLTGGAGYDVFIYSDGDGRDLITDYEPDVDRIMILSGKVENPTTDTAGSVTFRVGDGQIVIADGASKYIELFDSSGNNLTQKYIPR